MTMSIECIEVECPECRNRYETYFRGSMNLSLDDFDPDYVESMSTGTCPMCQHKVALGSLVVRPDGIFVFQDGD